MAAKRTHRSGDRNGTPAATAPGVEVTSGVETVAMPPVVAARCRGGVITAPAAADVSTAGDDVMDDDDDAALPSAISCAAPQDSKQRDVLSVSYQNASSLVSTRCVSIV
eukprot:COSAG06_NODE_4875_length_3888_cov_11.473740_4_plen_109_part_00